ncbi:adenylate/guanylate cyclase domain-containing protein [Brevibacillus borstelensis]|uniref:adenylate/guanylate cyclase domain-containing protein n=1 Tax=Brevibacillus borstelensis TaxID=45462 RepID=UPI0030BEBD2B
MKGYDKKYVWLFAMLAALLLLGVSLVMDEEGGVKKDEPFESINSIAANRQNEVVLIADAQQTITKLNADGTLRFRDDLKQVPEEGLSNFTDAALDEQGNVYALITQLDSFGLHALSERIVRYTPEGEPDRVIYQEEYGEKSEHQRIGTIRSLQTSGDRLSFYVVDKSEIKLFEYSPAESEASLAYRVRLPEGVYPSEIVGVQPGQTFLSTKKGEIYKIESELADGQARMSGPLYFHSQKAPGNKTPPRNLQLDSHGRLYFFNDDQNRLERLDPMRPQIVETVVSEDGWKRLNGAFSDEFPAFFLTRDDGMLLASDSSLLVLDAKGNLRSQQSAPYLGKYGQTSYWFWWAELGVFCCLLIAVQFVLFRLFQIPLIVKQMLVIIPLVIAPIFLQVEGTQMTLRFIEAENQNDLRLQTYVSSHLIDGGYLHKLSSADDYMNEDYKALLAGLERLEVPGDDSVNRGLYKTLYKYENGKLFLIMDDNDRVEMFQKIPLDDDFRRVLIDGKIISGRSQDRTGYWVYSMAPLYDSANKLVGILELGREMNGISMQHSGMSRMLAKEAAVVWAICGCLFFLFSWLTYRNIRNLQLSVSRMGKGDYDVVAKVRSMDEIQKLAESFNQMARRIRQYIANITRMNEANNRFVPQQFLHFLGKDSILDVRLGDQVEEEMAIMRMSAHAFYEMSIRLAPEETFRFINAFLKRFAPVVKEHDGIITEYQGPGVLALYPKNARDAVNAAIQMRRILEKYNEQRVSEHFEPIEINIALHHGPLMLGIIGEEMRMEANVISDHVHVAETLERMTVTLGARILISAPIFKGLAEPEAYQYRDLGWIQIEGKNEPMHLYDVYEGDPEHIRSLKEETKELFEQAIQMYQNGRFRDARSAFLQVIKQNRWDQAARLYFYNCDEYAQKGAEQHWAGELKIS